MGGCPKGTTLHLVGIRIFFNYLAISCDDDEKTQLFLTGRCQRIRTQFWDSTYLEQRRVFLSVTPAMSEMKSVCSCMVSTGFHKRLSQT